MIRFSVQQIALDDVDFEDTTFQISPGRKADQLARSINRLGLIQEPLLHRRQTALRIVSGFGRLKACRKLNWQTVSAKILPAESGMLDLVRLAITENAGQRPLTLVEQARCLSLLAEQCGTDDSALTRELAALDLKSWWGMRAKLLAVDGLHPELKHALQADTVGVAVALELGRWPATAAVQLVQIFKKLPLGLNRQRDMLTWVKEIALREGCARETICDEIEETIARAGRGEDRRAQVRQVQEKLFAWRYPRIAKAQKEFEMRSQSINFGPGIRLIPPAHFEAHDYRLEIRFQSREQLGDRLKRLQQTTALPELENLLSSYIHT